MSTQGIPTFSLLSGRDLNLVPRHRKRCGFCWVGSDELRGRFLYAAPRTIATRKTYIVRLTEEERQKCQEVIRKLKATSRKVRRAQILLKADADDPAWRDQRIAEAFGCRRQTVEKVLQHFLDQERLSDGEGGAFGRALRGL